MNVIMNTDVRIITVNSIYSKLQWDQQWGVHLVERHGKWLKRWRWIKCFVSCVALVWIYCIPTVALKNLREFKMETFSGRRQLQPDMTSWFVGYCACSCSLHCRRAPVSDVKILGTLRSDDGDGNGNAAKTIGLISKTTILHVHHAFLYISLPSLHDYDVKMPNYTMYRGRTQTTTKFLPSFWTWMWFL